MPLVLGGAALIVDGRAVLGGESRRGVEQLLRWGLPHQRLLGALRADLATDRGERDPGIVDRPAVHGDRGPGGGNRPVADPPLDLLVGAARAIAEGDADLDQHLTLLERALVGPLVELIHVEHTLARRAADHRPCPDGGADRRQVLGGIGMAECASDGPAVAHDRVGDHPFRVGEDLKAPRQELGLEQLAVPRHRADPRLAVGLADVPELTGEPVDVHQVLRRRQPQLHHRQQRVAAGEDARLRAEAAEQLQGVLDARCPLILERCWDLHPDPPFSPLRGRGTQAPHGLWQGDVLKLQSGRQPAIKRSLKKVGSGTG
jgi:hypothetical protein